MTECWYRGCTNVRITLSDKLVFFNVPKDEPRRSQWIERCGHWKTHRTTALIRRQVCEQHFAADDIRRQFYRTTLRRDALPVPWTDEDNIDDDVNEATVGLPEQPEDSVQIGKHTTTVSTIPLDVNETRGAGTDTTDAIFMDDENYYYEHLDICDDTYEQLSVEPATPADEEEDHTEDRVEDFEEQNAAHDDLAEVSIDDEAEIEFEVVVHMEDSRCDSTTELNVPADQTATDEPLADPTDASAVSDVEQKSQISPETDDRIIDPTTAHSFESALQRRALKRKMRQKVQRKRQQRMATAPTKRQPPSPKVPAIATEPAPTSAPAVAAASAVDPMQRQLTQEFPEDTYFALSLVGSLQRLTPQQRAMAKMNIVRYLTEMAFTDSATI